MPSHNEFGQPIGVPLLGWTAPPPPKLDPLVGAWARLEALLEPDHLSDLWQAFVSAPASLWTYMPFGPFVDRALFISTLEGIIENPGLLPYAICVDSVPVGFACYMRVEPAMGVLEIGSISFSPALQRSAAATEGLYLMIKHAFDLGYRRCEWKCDDLNAPSRSAATRLGFNYEGTFRKAVHYKGRNRDTAWYAITDDDWPALQPSFEAWLIAENFDSTGRQRLSLSEVRANS